MTSYIPEDGVIPDTNHANIAKRYITGEFLFDLIPCIPVFIFFDNSRQHFWRLLFLIKLMRMSKGLKMLDVMALMENIKAYYSA